MSDAVPRIDVLVTSDARRGAEVFGSKLAEGLSARGWDAELVSLTGGSDPRIPSTPLVSQVDAQSVSKMVRALRRRLSERNPGLVFANGGATLRQTVLATRVLARRPRIVYGSIGEPSYWLRGGAHRLFQRYLVGRCAHVMAVSEATRAGLVQELGVPPEKVTVVPPGVEEAWFGIASAPSHGGPLRVLFAGSLSAEKDPLTAVQAMARLSGDAQLRMVGEGPLLPRLQEAADENTEILGSVEDMETQLEWADVLLLTSRTEGLPGVAVEASAAGVPVVASRVGGTGEVVIDGETGLLVEPGDVDGFAGALKQMGDTQWRHMLGRQARQRARERFRLEDTLDAYDRVFREVAAR